MSYQEFETESYDIHARRMIRRLVDMVEVKPGEHVLIVADFATERKLIDGFAHCVVDAGGIPTMVIMPNAGWDPCPYALTKPAAKAYLGADVFIGITASSPAATWGLTDEIRKYKVVEKKLRGMNITEYPFKTYGIFDHPDEEHLEMWKNAEKIARIILNGKKSRITSKAGTDITAEIYGLGVECLLHISPEEFHPEYPKHRWGPVPPGGHVNLGCEVDWVPVYGTAEGTVVWDGPVGCVCKDHDEPIILTVEKSRVMKVKGGAEARIFKQLLSKHKNADQIVEMSIGLTPWWVKDGCIRTERKGLGNAHVTCGGWSPVVLGSGYLTVEPYIHMDGTIYHATLEIDGKKIVDDGEILV